MKAILFAFITATLFYSAIQTDLVKTASVYQRDSIDLLDPSRPKLA
ncbi:MAG: hypothetical protein H7336_00555 [Bacteriovorax sp.]|nr:hypothetical protein [Bacteriovorax sp.]